MLKIQHDAVSVTPHCSRSHAAAIIVLIVALAFLGIGYMVNVAIEEAFDRGFAAGQQYEEWFCSNTVTP